MNRTLSIFALSCLLSGAAYAAPTVATGQSTVGAQNMNNAVRKMKTQQVSHLEEQLEQRGMPPSIAKAPSKILKNAVQGPMKDRLELGLESEPAVVQNGATTSVEIRGTASSQTLGRAVLSSTTGNLAGPAAVQHIQSTTDNAPARPANVVYKDPREGIQLTERDVTTWQTSGNSTNATQVTGQAKIRTIQPLSPGLAFRNKKLAPGSHLVTTTTGSQVTVNFNPQGAAPTIASPANTTKSVSYVLEPKTSGGFHHTKVKDQELADVKASNANRSFTVNANGKIVDNAAPGYDQESLRAGGFTP